MRTQKTDTERVEWSRRYKAALRRFLRQGKTGSLLPATRLGRQAVPTGLETFDVARVHEQVLDTMTPPDAATGNAWQKLLERADAFFHETITPIEATHSAARKADIRIDRLTRTLRRRVAESSVSDEQLKKAVARREAVEVSADVRAVRHDKLLRDTQRIQKRLRAKMHCIMLQQEGERKRLGSKLRNDIAQALLAIDISLLALKTSGHVNTDKIDKSIAEARRILHNK